MDKIARKAGILYVPDQLSIPYIIGDRSRSEVQRSVHRIVDLAVSAAYGGKRNIEWLEVVCNHPNLSDKKTTLFRDCVVGMREPFFDPLKKTVVFPVDNLIQDFDLHTCFQPIRCVKGLNASFKRPEDVNLFLMTGGSDYAHDYIEIEYAKVIKSAIRLAINRGLPGVTIVHSENVTVSMEGAFRVWVYEIADKEFSSQTFSMNIYRSLFKLWGKTVADEELTKARMNGKVIIRDESIDQFLSGVSANPEDYSVVVALKCCGDYISDELTKMLGAPGILPRAYYNYESGHALFESVYVDNLHAVQSGLVSFIPDLLSALMLLNYFEWYEAENLIKEAIFHDRPDMKQNAREADLVKKMSGSLVRSLIGFKMKQLNQDQI